MTYAPSADEQAAIAREIAALGPVGWSSIRFTYQEVGPISTSELVAVIDGRQERLDADLDWDTEDGISDLRARMYRPGAGTWFTMVVDVFAQGRVAFAFDYDNPPAFDFAPNSWAEDAERFPRTAENTPDWLRAKVQMPDWVGARWQLDLTPGGAPRDLAAPVDATTTPQGHAWSVAIADRLAGLGYVVERRQDEGEDERGEPAMYDELLIDVGQGSTTLSFFRDSIFWTIELFADEATKEQVMAAARDVQSAVTEVTGYDLASPLDPYEAHLLGRAG